LNNILKM